jgi:hypothetical protein
MSQYAYLTCGPAPAGDRHLTAALRHLADELERVVP